MKNIVHITLILSLFSMSVVLYPNDKPIIYVYNTSGKKALLTMQSPSNPSTVLNQILPNGQYAAFLGSYNLLLLKFAGEAEKYNITTDLQLLWDGLNKTNIKSGTLEIKDNGIVYPHLIEPKAIRKENLENWEMV